MAVSERERSHFDAVKRAIGAAKIADCVEVAATSAADRVRTGFLLAQVPLSPAVEKAIDADALGQIGLARRRPAGRD